MQKVIQSSPENNTSQTKSLFEKFQYDTGFTEKELSFRTSPGKDEIARDTKIYFEDAKTGDVRIPYFDINGRPVKYENGTGKLRDFERIRFQNPEPGKGKYHQPPKSGSHIYFPPQVITLNKEKSQTKILYGTEGEKKALAGCKKLGLPFIGLPGIFGLKENDGNEPRISDELNNLFKNLGTKIFALVLDADALQAKYDINDPEKDLHIRASNFFRSVSLFKELITPLGIDLYLSVINPKINGNPKGLDDLLNHCDNTIVKKDFLALTTGQKEFTIWHNVTGQSDSKLKEFFGITHAEKFYNLHKDELKEFPFTLKRIRYQYNGEKLNILKDKNNDVFWKAEKDRDGVTKGCKIIYRKFIHFLNERGFKRYDLNSETFTFIHVENNVIKELSETKIQDYVKKYVETLPNERLQNDITKDDLAEKIYQSPQTYFSKPKLSLLDNSQLDIQRDTLTSAFVYYRNGFVEVTKDGYNLKEYKELENCIYADQQQQRDFSKGSEDGNFKKFVQNISGYVNNHNRFIALRTMLGYLMHDFHDYKLKAINLTDSKLSDDDEGRTGKTMFARSTQYLRKYLEVPGKTFDPSKSTKYQHASLTTQIVHLNDVQRGFRAEPVYNDITEGIEIDKKYDKPYFIKVKYILSSNKTLQIWGASARDRFVEFELTDYYSDDKGPDKEFNQWFWRHDWPKEEWNAFDNFMLECIRLFLENGIVQADTINLEERKLIGETNQEFIDFLESRRKDTATYYHEKVEEEIVFGIEFNKKQLHQEFLNENEEFRNDKYIRKQSTFTKWLQKYARYRNLEFTERKTGANRYMTFRQKPEN